MLRNLFKRLSFLVCWLTSSGMNFIWVSALRQFYMTDNLDSDYFRKVAGIIDNWVFLIFGFSCLLLVYMLNTFYQEDLKHRFLFITSLQIMLLSAINILTAGFKVKLLSTFELTWYYLVIWLFIFAGGLFLFNYIKKIQPHRLFFLKKLFKFKRNSYW